MCLSRLLFGSLDDEPECTVLGDAEDQEVRGKLNENDKGLVINYGEGRLQNEKITGPKLFVPPSQPPHQDSIKPFAPPILKSGNLLRPPFNMV